MLDILRPATAKARPAPPRPASPSTSPASSTSTLKASSSSRHLDSRSEHGKSHNRSSSISASRSKGQQARRESIESAVTSSHRHRYTPKDRQDDLLDFQVTSSSSSNFPPGLTPFRKSTLNPERPTTAQHGRGRTKLSRSSDITASAASTADPFRDEHSRTRKRSRAQKPLLGGLYFSDLIVVAFFYAVNLLRTCGIAELVDVAFKGFTYVCTRLPFDFYQRWSLSRPASSQFGRYPPLAASSTTQHHDARRLKEATSDHTSSDVALRREVEKQTSAQSASLSRTSSTAVSSSDDEEAFQEAYDDDAQLSPFHHLTLLLVRFACTSFPHLVPRVLFAEETIGPLVRWRTGGGAAGIVREFTSEQGSTGTSPNTRSHKDAPTRQDPLSKAAGTLSPSDRGKSKPYAHRTNTRPGFRAFWIGADAHVPVEVRRSDPSSKSATTLLYLHGGGFSLGSVAFYAEALIRMITKVCGVEDRENDARCVAVEYDLVPTSRFPGPLLQCLRCYAHLIEVEGIDPASITIAGDSAGGNLTMAMLLCLDGQAKSELSLGERDWSALPMPGKAVLISPWADLRPSSSLAFAPLREAAESTSASAKANEVKNTVGSVGSGAQTDARVSAWTQAIGQHEWDYVAAEALMHFAQLYSGVLQTPRRVRGPMGWVAHMCAVLAGDEDEVVGAKSEKGKPAASASTAPLAILRTLITPPKRMARAAHNMLTEPLLNRASTARSPFASSKKPASDAFNEVEHIRPSAVGALDPIFPTSERKTDAVPTTSDLYIPLWGVQADGQEEQKQDDEKDKRQNSDPNFEAAKELLETSKLINPAIGDWSRIKLKRGMLVLWGDRERLADDIETWVNHVRQSQSSRSGGASPGTDDQPSQDLDPSQSSARSGSQGRSLQERRAASRSPQRQPNNDLNDTAADWLCTAVEHGPGGVHAWPFVSMYLAGSESEREKGLEIIARFIAEPTPSPASTTPATPTSMATTLAVQLPSHHEDRRYLATAAYSPPHLNAVSPAGSMPSDVSSRGDDGENDYPFLGSSYTGSEDWDRESYDRNQLGLEGIYPHETVWAQPTPTPSTGMGTPMDSDVEYSSVDQEELAHRVGLGFREGASAEDRHRRGQTSPAPTMEPVHLHRPAQSAASVWDNSTAPRIDTTPRAVPRRPRDARRAQPQVLGGSMGGRSLADLEAESDQSAPPSQPVSPGWHSDSVGYSSHDEDDLSGPSPQELDRDAYFGGPVSYADDAIPMDPGFYGLAHYHTLRPEGLSDIAEEESQFDTSSVLSSGNGGSRALSPGVSDPSFSPENGTSPNLGAMRGTNPGRYGAAYTPSASEMARLREALEERERQYQQRFARAVATGSAMHTRDSGRFPIESDEDVSLGETSDADVDHLDLPSRDQQGVSPWRSSAELPTLAVHHSQSQQAPAPAPPSQLGIKIDPAPSSRNAEERPDGLRAPPSPAPSNSSRTSSAHDVWW